jgi:hypothetical protein
MKNQFKEDVSKPVSAILDTFNAALDHTNLLVSNMEKEINAILGEDRPIMPNEHYGVFRQLFPDRETYIEWVNKYADLINEVASHARYLKSVRDNHRYWFWQANFQSAVAVLANHTELLIWIRTAMRQWRQDYNQDRIDHPLYNHVMY